MTMIMRTALMRTLPRMMVLMRWKELGTQWPEKKLKLKVTSRERDPVRGQDRHRKTAG